MTVSTTNTKVPYPGNGVATSFAFNFKILSDEDLKVYLYADGAAAGSPLSLNVHYTVKGAGAENGGSVEMVTPPAAGQTLLIARDVPFLQQTDFKNQGRFFPETHERAFDRSVMMVQQVAEEQGRSINLPINAIGVSSELPVPKAGGIWGWDASGSSPRYYSPQEIAVATVVPIPQPYTFSGGIRPHIIAHRGFKDQAPQNTLAALSSSLRRGADALECDVQPSADGVLYCFHDTTVDAITDGAGTFIHLDSSYIDTLGFSETAGTFLSGVRIARLSEVLSMVAEQGVEIHVEIKAYRTISDVALYVQAVVDAGLEDKVWLHSSRFQDVVMVRDLNPSIGIGVVAGTSDPSVYEPTLDQMALLGRGIVAWSYQALLAQPAIVPYAKSRGIDLCAWTVNNQEYMVRLMRIGVRKIMSDVSLNGAP